MDVLRRSRSELHAAVLAAVAAFTVGSLVAAVPGEPPDVPQPVGSILTYDADGCRYSYHVLTGSESLFDLSADPHQLHDVSRSRPELTRKLRRALESKLHVDRLDSLRSGEADRIRMLRSLGYL